jgi:hypothetical protein
MLIKAKTQIQPRSAHALSIRSQVRAGAGGDDSLPIPQIYYRPPSANIATSTYEEDNIKALAMKAWGSVYSY